MCSQTAIRAACTEDNACNAWFMLEGNPIPEDPVRPIDMDIVVVNVVVIVAVIVIVNIPFISATW